MGAIMFDLYYLSIWYRIPHKEVHYNANIAGSIGSESCTVYLGMDYSDEPFYHKEQLGAKLTIKHACRSNSPCLFQKTNDCFRNNRIREFYESLFHYDSILCNRISTVYSTRIDILSNLYDFTIPHDQEIWTKDHLVAIRKFKSLDIKRNLPSGTSSETWFYLERLPASHSCNNHIIALCSQSYNNFDHFKPRLNSKGDISKLDCKICLNLDSRLDCETIIINTVGPIELISVNISPDIISFNKFIYSDKTKILQIRENGLRFYAEFPEAQKIQNLRISILLLVLPIWITLLIKLIRLEFKRLAKIRKYISIT